MKKEQTPSEQYPILAKGIEREKIPTEIIDEIIEALVNRFGDPDDEFNYSQDSLIDRFIEANEGYQYSLNSFLVSHVNGKDYYKSDVVPDYLWGFVNFEELRSHLFGPDELVVIPDPMNEGGDAVYVLDFKTCF